MDKDTNEYNEIITKQYADIGFFDISMDKADKKKLIEMCGRSHRGIKLLRANEKRKMRNSLYMSRYNLKKLKKYLKTIDFEPVAAFIGYEYASLHFGHLMLYAITDGELYKIDFRMQGIHGHGSTANDIDSINRLRVFASDKEDKYLSHIVWAYEEDDGPYGFGALWSHGPELKTREQKNLYSLKMALRRWSVDNKINNKLRSIQRLKKNMGYDD